MLSCRQTPASTGACFAVYNRLCESMVALCVSRGIGELLLGYIVFTVCNIQSVRCRDACVHRPQLLSMQPSASLQANVELKDKSYPAQPSSFSSSCKIHRRAFLLHLIPSWMPWGQCAPQFNHANNHKSPKNPPPII